MPWKKKRTDTEKAIQGAITFVMIPFDMWLVGIAVHGLTGHDISRGESLAIVVLFGTIAGMIARGIRYYLTDI